MTIELDKERFKSKSWLSRLRRSSRLGFLKKAPDRRKASFGLLSVCLLLGWILPDQVRGTVTSCDPGYYLNAGTCTICAAGKFSFSSLIPRSLIRQVLHGWSYSLADLCGRNVLIGRLLSVRHVPRRPLMHNKRAAYCLQPGSEGVGHVDMRSLHRQ